MVTIVFDLHVDGNVDRDDDGGGGGGGDTRIPAGTVEMAERFCEQHRQGCFQVSVHVT